VKFFKLLTVPAVLALGVLLAVPAFAHSLGGATIEVACGSGQQAGQVCVHLKGQIAEGTAERFVFVDVFAQSDKTFTTSLGEVVFDITAFDSKNASKNQFDQTLCFPAIKGSTATSFTVAIVKVTSDSAGKHPADLTIHLSNGKTITFGNGEQPPVAVGTTDKCVAPSPSPSPSPSASVSPMSSPTASPTANTTAVLAQTGGFDFRFPLVGLVLLVAGGSLFFISASRGRSANSK
jgi:hypothetical protein